MASNGKTKMNEREIQEFRDLIKAEIHADMVNSLNQCKEMVKQDLREQLKSRNGAKVWIVPIVVLLTQFVLMGVTVPWVKDVNAELKQFGTFVQNTPANNRVLRMEAVAEAAGQINIVAGRLDGKLDALQTALAQQAIQIAQIQTTLNQHMKEK